jgi:2-oxoglutarate ferredoxin oxidoreductase subunit alpha
MSQQMGTAKILMKGNEAIAEAAIRAGCEAYYGYPITPQTEVLEYMAQRMPALGRAFVQAESEIAAINMVYGAACAGVRTMTSTSSPGFSLMQEGISYIACSEVPAVIVNVMRGGPGLGNIQPAQGDYNQMVKGGGHGDYHAIVLAPSTVQETLEHVTLAFDLAEKYRTVVLVMADGMIGQIMEPVELPEFQKVKRQYPDYALRGCQGRKKRIITSLYLGGPNLEKVNDRLQARLGQIIANEQRWETFLCGETSSGGQAASAGQTTSGKQCAVDRDQDAQDCEAAEIIVVAFGTAARIAKTAIRHAHALGIRAGLFRPITAYPFPYKALAETAAGRTRGDVGKKLLVFELNAGQMLEDVRLAVRDGVPITFFGKTGGVVPLPEDLLEVIKQM